MLQYNMDRNAGREAALPPHPLNKASLHVKRLSAKNFSPTRILNFKGHRWRNNAIRSRCPTNGSIKAIRKMFEMWEKSLQKEKNNNIFLPSAHLSSEVR